MPFEEASVESLDVDNARSLAVRCHRNARCRRCRFSIAAVAGSGDVRQVDDFVIKCHKNTYFIWQDVTYGDLVECLVLFFVVSDILCILCTSIW